MTRLVALAVLALPLAGQQRDTLPDSAVVLRPVVVTATRNDLRPVTAPLAASALIPTPALRGEARVSVDLLRDLPGIHVQQTSAGQGAVVLRGLIGNQVLYLVDGIPLNNGTYRDGPGQYLATVDPEAIARIEVVRGPASVLYGSDAQGGVVHLITAPHLPDALGTSVRGTIHLSGANRGTRGRLSAGYRDARLRADLGVSVQQTGDLRAGGGLGAQRPTGFDTEGVDGRIAWRATPEHTLTASVSHFAMHDVPRYDRYVDFRTAPGADAVHAFDPQTRQLAWVRHRWSLASRILTQLETTASVAVQHEGRTTQGLAGDGTAEPLVDHTRDDVHTPGLSIVAHSLPHLLGREITLTWGGEAYRDVLRTSGSAMDLLAGTTTALDRGRFPDGATMLRAGVFLAAESELSDRVRANGGLRWSAFRTEADVGPAFGGAVVNDARALTAQGGLAVQPVASVTLAARVAGGFRAPNLYDLTNVGTVPGGIVVPNPDARPEQSVSTDLGVRWDGPTTAVDITVWRTTIDDFLDRAPGAFAGDTLYLGERVFQGVNVAEARLVGVEAEAAQALGPIVARTAFQFTRGDQTDAAGVETPMAKIPPVSGSVSATWRAPQDRLAVTGRLRWAARQDRLHPRDERDSRIQAGGTPGYAVFGLETTWRATRALVIAAGLDNLTDALYRTHASGVDGPGRSVWVGLTLTDAP